MQGGVSSVAVITQSVVAGLIAGLCMLQWVWWRGDRGRNGSSWLLAWTAALAALLGVNIALALTPTGADHDAILFVRSQVLAVCVILALPTVRAFTGGPPVRPWVLAVTAAYTVRAVLWLSTDLVLVRGIGEPMARGPLAVPTFLVGLAAVCSYLVIALRTVADRRTFAVIASTSTVSVTLLALPYLVPPGPWTHPMAIVWAVPLAGGLTVLGLRRLAQVERDTRRQHAMRDALSEVSDMAWSATEPEGVLAHAEATARRQLGDPALRCAVLPQPGGRFTTTITPSAPAADQGTRAFLDDLARLVSLAAERITLARDLREAAFTDALTGLPNRYALERHLAEAIDRATERDTQLTVLYCDLDGLKAANDVHGHAWGDEVLLRTARHLRACAEPDDMVARFDGDEFVVVVEEQRAECEVMRTATRMRAGAVPADGAREPALPVSVGVARWCPGSAGAAEHLLRQADAAMLESKRTRTGVALFDDDLRVRMQRDEELRRDLDVALARGEFVVHFQPVVEAHSLAVVGVEALARWQHDGRLRMPGEWLAFAEETGLIIPIGRSVLGTARTGAARMGHPVMVNVAARQLAEPGYLDQLVADLGDGPWTGLTLEITESALLQDLPHVVQSLRDMRSHGARIAIDDFGTGYSSFARLASLPVDVLKIDRAFVQAVTTEEGAAVVRAIVTLARAFRLDVVAEGVETVEQLDALIELGVPKLQGYLLGRPSAGRPAPVRVARPGAGA